MDFKVNMSTEVKVQLTDFGKSILKEQREELNSLMKIRGEKGIGELDFKLDEEGYYVTQLWSLMKTFGPYISLTKEEPFDMDIIICNGEQVESGFTSLGVSGKELWDAIEQKARLQERIGDNWKLTKVDMGAPIHPARVEYSLTDTYTENKIEGTLYEWEKDIFSHYKGFGAQ